MPENFPVNRACGGYISSLLVVVKQGKNHHKTFLQATSCHGVIIFLWKSTATVLILCWEKIQESQSYVYMLFWLYDQNSLKYNRGSLPEIQLVNWHNFYLAGFLHVKSKHRAFPRYCLDGSCALAFGGRFALASHCPIQPSFPMACSWLWIIASLLLHLCPNGQVGCRNLIQLKNTLWKKI